MMTTSQQRADHLLAEHQANRKRNMTDLEAMVSDAMQEPGEADPEVSADAACETALNALDQLMLLAAKNDTFPHVMANKIFIGQILTRAQLVASFLIARETPKLSVVRTHG